MPIYVCVSEWNRLLVSYQGVVEKTPIIVLYRSRSARRRSCVQPKKNTGLEILSCHVLKFKSLLEVDLLSYW